MPRIYAVNPAPFDAGTSTPQRPMARHTPARKKNGQFAKGTRSTRANPAPAKKARGKTSDKVYKKTTRGKKTTFTRLNPAPLVPAALLKQGVALLGGQIVAGIAAGKVTEMLPAEMDTKMQALAGAGVSAAIAALAITQDNPMLQMMGVGAGIQTAKTAIKTFAGDAIPGLGDVSALSDGMDLGEIAVRSSYRPGVGVRAPRPRTLYPMPIYPTVGTIQPIAPPVYALPVYDEPVRESTDNPALPVEPPKSRAGQVAQSLPASLRFAGSELGSPAMDYQTVN